MIDFTPIARSIFSRRARKLRDYSSFSVEEMQLGTLSALVRRLSRTSYGSRYGITDGTGGFADAIADFAGGADGGIN